MDYRGPKTGYNFSAKEEYRENVWKCFAENLPVDIAKVVFLPSKEGLEIPVALKYGFKEENLIAIDENPALLASAKWRKKYPKIKCYGSKVGKAFNRIEKDGIRIAAANLDFCNNLSQELIQQVTEALSTNAFYDEFMLSLTMLKGREPTLVNILMDYIEKEQKKTKISKRCFTITKIIEHLKNAKSWPDYFIKINKSNEYKSGNLVMEYIVYSIKHVKILADEQAESMDILRTSEECLLIDDLIKKRDKTKEYSKKRDELTKKIIKRAEEIAKEIRKILWSEKQKFFNGPDHLYHMGPLPSHKHTFVYSRDDILYRISRETK